jgi:starch synthase
LTVYFVDQPDFYQRSSLYQNHGVDYPDNAERFMFFSKAVAHLAMHLAWKPELLHLNDWQTGFAALLLRHQQRRPECSNGPRTCLTVHNLAYQGVFPPGHYALANLPWEYFTPAGVEFYGQVNCLKAGIAYADRITTVSPTYAEEIKRPDGGAGLGGLLAHRARDLKGILNGVDYGVWNPATSRHLEYHYDAARLSGRKINKNLLQRAAGLEEAPDAPLFAVVSRLAQEKGLDLVLENIAYLIQLSAQLLVLGKGDPELEAGFRAAAGAHPGRVVAWLGFDEGLAHRILAGADVILVPSRQEPCGLTQLYALRYGALPLVRRTGGLADTVVDADAQGLLDSTATGFVFREPNSWILGETIGRACQVYRQDPRAWTRIQRHGMAQDFGWAASAREYLDLFGHLSG